MDAGRVAAPRTVVDAARDGPHTPRDLPGPIAGGTAGIVSHVPGGVGVFETVVVIAVPQIPADAMLGSLLAYRAIFYLAPLGVATVMFAAEEFGAQRLRLAQARARASAFIGPVVPSVVGALTFIAGAELLFSGATRNVHTGIASYARLLPLPVVEFSHLAGSAIGLALLILARHCSAASAPPTTSASGCCWPAA